MNKVITINLNGVAYQLEEGGYDALRAYLENAARRLEGNPDRDEIITDIEQAIADKFRALLGAYKTVVNTKEVAAVLTEMGPVEDATGETAAGEGQRGGAGQGTAAGVTGSAAAGETGGVRRLYRIYPEGAMLSGVCNGLAAYFNIDATIFRLGFVILTMLWGAGALLYLFMVILIPLARTPAEKTAATGAAATAQEFIRRAKAGYYEGFKTFHDRKAHREWKRKFKQDMRCWTRDLERDVKEHAHQWVPGWQSHWAPRPPPVFGPVFIAPILSILLLVALVLLVWGIYSLASAGHVFGVVLPAGMPLWGGILLLVFVYLLVTWPIKAIRYACYYPGPYYGHCGPWNPLGSLIGLFFFAFGIWMLDRHVPVFHEWLVQMPALLHQFSDAVKVWWTKPA